MAISQPFDPGSPDPTVCPTLDELRALVRLAETEGWDALPRDCPERGTVGWTIVRDGEERTLEYALYGKRLEPVESMIENVGQFERLAASHEGHESFEYQQWPTERTVGFVCCCESENGSSRVVKISPFRNSRSQEEKAVLLGVHEASKKNRGPWFERGLMARL